MLLQDSRWLCRVSCLEGAGGRGRGGKEVTTSFAVRPSGLKVDMSTKQGLYIFVIIKRPTGLV